MVANVAGCCPTSGATVFFEYDYVSLSHESRDKIRDVLSSVLGSAVEYDLLIKNPVANVRMPAEKRGKKRNKPFLNPKQFEELVQLAPEPYATMIYVAIFTGLRVSELIGLKWEDVGFDLTSAPAIFSHTVWEVLRLRQLTQSNPILRAAGLIKRTRILLKDRCAIPEHQLRLIFTNSLFQKVSGWW